MITIYLTDVFGRRITELANYDAFECVSAVNGVGQFALTYNVADFPYPLFMSNGGLKLDQRIEVWRFPGGRTPQLVFCGFIRKYTETAQGYRYTEDYSDEVNFVYCGGKGTDAARTVTDTSNADRMIASVINRREGFYQQTNIDDVSILQDGGREMLYEERPKVKFEPVDIEVNYIWPTDWALGDVLRVQYGQPETIIIGGPDLNDLLQRRVIGYKSASAQASKNDFADDMMKAFVYENLGAGATDAARIIDPALGFTIQGDQSAGPTVEHSATYGNLYDTLKAISDKSAEAGNRVYFNVIPIAGDVVTPQFVTGINRLGRDRTDLRIGAGNRQSDMLVTGVSFTVEEGAETIRPKLEDVHA